MHVKVALGHGDLQVLIARLKLVIQPAKRLSQGRRACLDSTYYDVRFIFVRPVEDYLRVEELPDYIDAELNELYDINGWDLKKLCKQLFKSNPVIFEWANSPIV